MSGAQRIFLCPWTEIIECKVCDGCSYELTITYKDNRKKKMHGDLGGGTVDKTVTDFLCTIPEMKEKIDTSEDVTYVYE